MSAFASLSWPQRLGIAAALLGVLAAFAGSPYAARHGRIDVEALAGTVEREDDHVTAVELGRWIKERRPGLRVIDVRSAVDFDAYHLPGAERVPLGALAATPFRADETIVLYSDGGAHAAQGWVFLRSLGITTVYFLRGGLNEWLDDVMSPMLSADATPAERATFDSVADVSRYFGGVPQRREPDAGRRKTEGSRTGNGANTRPTPAAGARLSTTLQRVRKRGC